MSNTYENSNLVCCNCGAEFIFPIEEQKHFNRMGFSSPKRCRACRKKRRQQKDQQTAKILAEQKEQEQAKRKQEKANESEQFKVALAAFDIIDMASMKGDAARNLFVIGNGFDLMHDVPSSYYDFQATLGKNNPLRSLLETYLHVDSIWADFEEALGHLNIGMMLKDTIVDLWLDDFGAYDPDAQAADFFAAVETVVAPAITISRELPRRFRMWVERLTLKSDKRPLQNLITNSKVLCFNYTEFIEQLYNVSKENVCYIHGCRRKEKYHPKEILILGHRPGIGEDEWDVNMEVPNFNNQYKRYMVETAYDAASQYLSWYDEDTTKNCAKIIKRHQDFFDSLHDIEKVIVIGHSMSEVDWDYFEEINRNCDNAHWYLGCHNLKGLNHGAALMARLSIAPEKVSIFRI